MFLRWITLLLILHYFQVNFEHFPWLQSPVIKFVFNGLSVAGDAAWNGFRHRKSNTTLESGRNKLVPVTI